MRVRRRRHEDPGIVGINIVPVIDLCLVLLVILLVISPMLDKAPVEVVLPKAQTIEEKGDNIAITLSPTGEMALNTDKITRQELPRSIKGLLSLQGPDTLVIIRADQNVDYGTLTDLLKLLKDNGAKNISLGTEQKKPAGV